MKVRPPRSLNRQTAKADLRQPPRPHEQKQRRPKQTKVGLLRRRKTRTSKRKSLPRRGREVSNRARARVALMDGRRETQIDVRLRRPNLHRKRVLLRNRVKPMRETLLK